MSDETMMSEGESTQEVTQEPVSDPIEQVNVSTDAPTEPVVPGGINEYLPEEMHNDPSLKDFKSVEDLAKSYKSAETMIGGSIRIPGEDASQEQKESFYAKLKEVPGVTITPDGDNPEEMDNFLRSIGKGKPESATEYKVDIPDVDPNDPMLGTFKDFAHQTGLTQDQAQQAVEFHHKLQQNEKSMMGEYAATALKEKWGADYDTRLQGANAALKTYEPMYPEAVKALRQSAHGNNPAIIAMLSDMAHMMQESGVATLPTTPKYGLTPDEAKMKVEEIQSNKSHPYHNAYDPNHNAAVERVQKYYEMMYPNKS